jgi:quercetin dioxygenase-like cupin family protein
MNSLGLALFGWSFGLIVGLAVSALAADTQPSLPEPVEVRYSPPSHPAVLGTTFVDWDALVPRYTPVGRSMPVFDNPTAALPKFEVHITTLRPGMISHAVHHHAWEEMLLIKEGSVEVSINGKKYPAGPGFLVFFASHDPHNLKNVGTTDATYYVINFVTDLVQSAVDRPASEQGVPGKLSSSVIDCDGLPKTATPSGFRVPVLDSPTLTFQRLVVHITTLNPGQRTRAEMIDPGDELFIVRSGVVEATVNGITSRMKEGSLFYCAPNDKRTFKNDGAFPASYQVFKVLSDKSPH